MVRNNLKLWREARGMSREDLAEKLGVSLASISRIEDGKQQPRTKLLEKIVDIFYKTNADFYGEISNVEPIELGIVKVPLLNEKQVVLLAGSKDLLRNDVVQEFILTNGDHSGMAFAFNIRGDSMLPEFKEGQQVIIDPEASIRPGDFVVAKDNAGTVFFRKYRALGPGAFELVPLNDDFAPMRSDMTALDIVGTMIEHRIYRKK